MSLLQALTARRDAALAALEAAEPTHTWRFRCTYSGFVTFTTTLSSGERVEARVYDQPQLYLNRQRVELTLVGG